MKYGDISLNDGGGSWNLKSYMQRWNLIEDDNDWRQLLGDIKKMSIVKKYLDESTSMDVTDWRRFFINDKYSVLKYIEQNKFLRQDEEDDSSQTRIVLLSGHQAGEYNSREIQIQIFHKCINQSWVYKYDTCVLEYDIVNGEIIIGKKNDENYYLNIKYVWNKTGGEWFLFIGHRKRKFGADNIDPKCLIENGIEFVNGKIKFVDNIFTEDISKSMEDNIDAVKVNVTKFLSGLMNRTEIIKLIQ